MDSTVIAAIIGGAVMLLIDIWANIRGAKSNRIKINDLSEQLNKGFDSISEKLKKESSTISDELGTQTRDRKNLSSQHEDMVDLIKSKAKEHSDNFAEQLKTINEINERDKKEIAVREELQKHLSPEMLEIKKVSEAFQSMEKQMEELKLQNDILIKKLEAQTQAKRNAELKHEQFLNEINALSDDELLSFFKRKNIDTDDCSDGQGNGRGRRR